MADPYRDDVVTRGFLRTWYNRADTTYAQINQKADKTSLQNEISDRFDADALLR